MNRSILTAILFVFAASAPAAPPADVDAYVAKAMQAFDAPGFSLAIVENGKTVHAKGYGVRELGKKTPADEHTIFPMGSCTKAMTAAALAVLVDEGKLSWDDKVADRLPGFRMYDPYTTANMNVRDLLAHNSGLPLGAGDLLWLGGSDYSRRGIMERLRYIKPVKSFREGYAYDNVLYAVAGLLVEQVSGMTWETFMEKRVFGPLGMKDSTVPWVKAQKSRNHASLHARISTELRGTGPNEVLPPRDAELDNGSTAPAGSVYASAVDIAKWMQVQLAKGALPDGKRLWSEPQAQAMWTGVTIQPTRGGIPGLEALRPNFSLYALGWVVEDYRGHKIIQHSGGVFGGAALVVLIPGKNVGIAGMVNSEDGATRRAVVYHLVDQYLGLEEVDWIGTYRKVLDQMQAMGAKALKEAGVDGGAGAGAGPGPSLPLEKYAGVYEDAWYGTLSIKHDGKALQLQFDRTPRLHAPLEHVRFDTFRTRFPERNIEDAYVTFALNPDGSIDQVKMKAVSPLADFSFNYHDLLLKPVPKK